MNTDIGLTSDFDSEENEPASSKFRASNFAWLTEGFTNQTAEIKESTPCNLFRLV